MPVFQKLTQRNYYPEQIHEYEVSPEIECLRPRVREIQNVVIEHAGGVV